MLFWLKTERKIADRQAHYEHIKNKEEQIKLAAKTSNELFQTNFKEHINRILDRKRSTINIDRYKHENGITFVPENVKEGVAKEMTQWMRRRQITPFAPGSVFEKAYKPLEHIQTNIYDCLDEPISKEEVLENLHNMGKDKAQGPSGISREFYLMGGLATIELLTDICQHIIDYNCNPENILRSTIVLIPKREDWGGDIMCTRPIALLDTFYKLIE
jgi:hypothetical protein